MAKCRRYCYPLLKRPPDIAVGRDSNGCHDLVAPDGQPFSKRHQPIAGRCGGRCVRGSGRSPNGLLRERAALMIGLAVLATIPDRGNLLTLGYFLEATGRIARSGRIRDGFVGVRKAARVGGILLVLAILILPLEFVASLWNDAELIFTLPAPIPRAATGHDC